MRLSHNPEEKREREERREKREERREKRDERERAAAVILDLRGVEREQLGWRRWGKGRP